MRKALRPSGRLAFACWRTPRDNPWMMLGLREAYKHVPKLPELGPEDPGPFSFAKEAVVHRILDEAGFSAIAMEDQPPEKIAAVTEAIRTALAAHVKGSAVPLGASIWIVTATNAR